MKHYLELVPISSKVHRKQNRMCVFCILLAVFLVAAIFGMADMFIRSQILQARIEGGNWHMALSDIEDEDAAVLSVRPDIKCVSFYGALNYRGNQGYTINGKEAVITGSDRNFSTEIFEGIISSGNFPQSASEAMVSENTRELLGLSLGDSIEIDSTDGRSHTFTISGFIENTGYLMRSDFYGIMLSQEGFEAFCSGLKGEDRPGINYYVQFKNTFQIQKKIADVREQFGFPKDQVHENTKLLGLLGQSGNSFMMQTYAAAGILFVLVLCAAIMMITSSLNSNVAQRTEFFGLMRCIGATPVQVMRMVRKEALGWCRLAIPMGTGAGILLVWILCTVLRILSPVYFREMPAFGISLPGIGAGAAAGFLTVILAARSPARKASGVSPLAAVSGNASVLQPVRKAANTRLLKIETALGIHHAKSGRKNFILTSLSFALSIVLFLSFSVTIDFMNHSLTPLYPWSADVSIISKDNTCTVDRRIAEKLEENPAVQSAYGRMFWYDVPAQMNGIKQKVSLVSYEEQQFEWSGEYLQEGSLEAVREEKNTALFVYNPQSSIQTGDTIRLEIKGKPVDIEIVGLLSAGPFHMGEGEAGILVFSEETFRQVTGEQDYTILDLQLTPDATDADVNAIHHTYGQGYTFSDERMDNESAIGVYYCIWLFLYGFLAVIVLIAVFHVINTIALSVSSRMNQYGAFRAIGLSVRQLKRMIRTEACTYTVAGCAAGAILGLAFHNLLFQMLIGSKWGDTWTIPWTELGVILLIMMLSVIAAVHGPIKKIRKMSVVDTISAQ